MSFEKQASFDTMCGCCPSSSGVCKIRKNSIKNRWCLTPKEYIELLCQPRTGELCQYHQVCLPEKERPPKNCLPPSKDVCSPRVDQLAIPTQKLMLSVLETYHEYIGPERVIRLVKVLHDNENQRPKPYIADKMKKKLKQKKKKKKDKHAQKEAARKWLCNQINDTTRRLMRFIRHKPTFTPNYTQVLISLRCLKHMKVKRRCKKNKFTRPNLLKIWEQVAIIADSLCNPIKQICLLYPQMPEEAEPEEEERKKIEWEMKEEDADVIGDILEIIEDELEEGEEEGEGEGEGEEEEMLLWEESEEGEEGEVTLGESEAEGEEEGEGGEGEEEEDEVQYPGPTDSELEMELQDGEDGMGMGGTTGLPVIVEEGGPTGEGGEPGDGEGKSPGELDEEEKLMAGLQGEDEVPGGGAPDGGAGGAGGADGQGAGAGEEDTIIVPDDGVFLLLDEDEEGEEGKGGGAGGLPADMYGEEGGEDYIPSEDEEGEGVGAEEAEAEEGEGLEEGEEMEGEVRGSLLGHPPGTVSFLAWKIYTNWLEGFGSNIQKFGNCLKSFPKDTEDLENTKALAEIKAVLAGFREYLTYCRSQDDQITAFFKGKKITKCPQCLGTYEITQIPEYHELPPELIAAIESTQKWRMKLDEVEAHCRELHRVQQGESASLDDTGTMEFYDITSVHQEPSSDSVVDVRDVPPGGRPGQGQGPSWGYRGR